MTVTKALLVAKGPNSCRPEFGPLATFPVANRPLLEHALLTLESAGVDRIAVVAEPGVIEPAGRMVDSIRDRASVGIELFSKHPVETLEDCLAMTAEVIGDDPFVLHLGDSLCWDLDLRLEQPLGETDSIVLVRPPDNGASADPASARSPGHRQSSRLGHLGIYVVGAEFRLAAAAIGATNGLNADTHAAISVLTGNGGRTQYWPQAGAWRDSGEPRAMLDANRCALARLVERNAPPAARDTDIQGPVHAHPSATIESSVIRGPVVIGPRSHIREAYLGPYTAIGADVIIEGAEVSYSVLMEGASVRNVGERLEASVLGPGACVCRDFRLPRALRLEVSAGAQIVLV